MKCCDWPERHRGLRCPLFRPCRTSDAHTGCSRTTGRPSGTVCWQIMVFLQLIISPPDSLKGEQIMQIHTFESFPSCLIRSSSALRLSPAAAAAACLCHAPCLTVCLPCTGCLNRVNDASRSHETACADPQKSSRSVMKGKLLWCRLANTARHGKELVLSLLCLSVCLRVELECSPTAKQHNSYKPAPDYQPLI